MDPKLGGSMSTSDAELIKRLEDVFRFHEGHQWHYVRDDLLREALKRLKQLTDQTTVE